MAVSRIPALATSLALIGVAGAQNPFGDIAGSTTGVPCVDALVTADFDGDGDPDVLVGSVSTNQLLWSENLGGGTLAPVQPLVGSAEALSIDAADLDGDGLPDAIAVDRSPGNLVWFRSLGGGAFSQARIVSSSVAGARWVEAADIDGDGDPDVVAAAQVGNAVLWVENLGGGAFGPTLAIDAAAPQAVSVATGDLDGDGDIDVAAALEEIDQFVWYENLGGGAFGPQTFVSSFFLFRPEVGIADYDGDGAMDVITSAIGCGVWGSAGSGTGSFAAPVQLTPSSFCSGGTAFELEDHDLDGDVDVFATNFGTTTFWTEGLGGGQFGTTFDIGFFAFPCAALERLPLDSADMDGDGDLDLVTFRPNALVWYENETITLADCNGNGVPDLSEIAADRALDLDGNSVLDDCEALGVRYCSPAMRNSTGAAGELLVLGAADVSANDVMLAARSLPTQAPGYFLTSLTTGFSFPVNNSQGALCVSGAIGRFIGPGQVLTTDSAGSAALTINVNALPTPTGPVSATPMSTWHFTFWHRDANPTSTSNFTDAVSLTFL
ncbi:MAG: VCBS repeat-containing protein [Planctomycetota bacterium]